MNHTGYIIDTAIEQEIPKGVLWHAERIPGTAKSLVAISWDGSENHATAFEARPDVLPLGQRWETMPVEASAILSSMQTSAAPSLTAAAAPAVVDISVAPDTVTTALRKMDSAVARLIR